MELSSDIRSLLPIWRNSSLSSQQSSGHHDDNPTQPLPEKGASMVPTEMGLRRLFNKKALPLALALPWVISMLISWIPFTKIGVSEAPNFLLLAGMISSLEVLSIIAVLICTSMYPESFNAEPAQTGRPSSWQEKFFQAWFWFLFSCPFCTSILVVLMVNDISCDKDDDMTIKQPVCRVGIRLIKGTALCRAGIILIFLFATSSLLESQRSRRPESQQSRRGSSNTVW
ncbi:Hypothetical protein NCS54_01474500 [Fusarium falciforme]|uniref:Hypothetical protein n=1 Tax=Fusarium falciforme TaxID=195108 RepID=UPI0023016A33|nr:Hypothetical protein NCS54_01474500 [Fusarium falciforme]WAO97040.1 Hypothetical protein NCS54_01474500 [Fusarium falciforme]